MDTGGISAGRSAVVSGNGVILRELVLRVASTAAAHHRSNLVRSACSPIASIDVRGPARVPAARRCSRPPQSRCTDGRFVPRLSSLARCCLLELLAAMAGGEFGFGPVDFARRLSTVVGLTVAIGSVAITRALITLAHGSQHLTQSLQNFWNQYAWAFPSDALGLVPRSPRETPGIG